MKESDEPLLVVFDVDGTLVDAAELDNASFDQGFRDVTGSSLPPEVWSEFEEITAQAIIRRASSTSEIKAVQRQVRESFLARLRTGFESDKASVRPFPGAIELLDFLRSSPDFRVAIATGCWEETARFKLEAAGFNLDGIPFASGSDDERRSEIIRLASKRAGSPLVSAVYVGDGVWDLRAANILGIPFIGVGRDVEKLRREGAHWTSENLSVEGFLEIREEVRRERLRLSWRI